MRILVACEFSGIVRDSFLQRGHDAWSCDLLPTESPGPHIQGDVLPHLGDGWDLMIAHPPCTHLTSSGARWFAAKRADGRQAEGIEFFMALVNAPIPRMRVENPVGIMSRVYRKPDQIIQPWQFGHDASKTTCLWLRGLPPLVPTTDIAASYSCRCGANFVVELGKYGCPNCCGENGAAILGRGPKDITKSGRVLPRWYNRPPGEGRSDERSRTFPGIAEEMAEQWG